MNQREATGSQANSFDNRSSTQRFGYFGISRSLRCGPENSGLIFMLNRGDTICHSELLNAHVRKNFLLVLDYCGAQGFQKAEPLCRSLQY